LHFSLPVVEERERVTKNLRRESFQKVRFWSSITWVLKSMDSSRERNLVEVVFTFSDVKKEEDGSLVIFFYLI
jgi:hypothetical protein